MKIAMLGAGAWGTAMAIRASHAHPVTLWARDAAQVATMQAARANQRYLPDQAFPAGLQLSDQPLAHWLASQDLVVLASPWPPCAACWSAWHPC